MRSSSPRESEQGFALVSTLIVTVLISLLASMLLILVRSLAEDGDRLAAGMEARAGAEAGLNRMIISFSRPGDAFRELLVGDGRAVAWEFHGRTLALRVEAESGKLDVNAADREHIRAVLERLVDDADARSRFLAELDRARSTGTRITSIAALMPPLDSLTSRLDKLEGCFTVMTNQTGIDPMTAAVPVIETMPGLSEEARTAILSAQAERRPLALADIPAAMTLKFSAERPIYTFRAETSAGFRRAMAMSAIVGFGDHGKISIYSWAPAGLRRAQGINDTARP